MMDFKLSLILCYNIYSRHPLSTNEYMIKCSEKYHNLTFSFFLWVFEDIEEINESLDKSIRINVRGSYTSEQEQKLKYSMLNIIVNTIKFSVGF